MSCNHASSTGEYIDCIATRMGAQIQGGVTGDLTGETVLCGVGCINRAC